MRIGAATTTYFSTHFVYDIETFFKSYVKRIRLNYFGRPLRKSHKNVLFPRFVPEKLQKYKNICNVNACREILSVLSKFWERPKIKDAF